MSSPVNERIRRLLSDITSLEDELLSALHEQETKLHFRIIGKRVEFEKAIRRRHRELRTGLLSWLAASEWRNLLSAPFVYALVVPLVIFDIGVTLFQAICFRLYRIPRVRRGDYIVLDRHSLGYLNVMERLHCVYCAYANGLVAYGREIAGRTEQYWCPIKHARRILGVHPRYANFLDYGAADGYQEQLTRLRAELRSARGARRAG